MTSKNPELFTDDDFLKDCPNHELVPTILPAVKRLIAIGDIHGDLNLAIQSFKLAKLINDNFEWIAEPRDTVVVQVGDQIDSCRPIPNVYDCHNKAQAGDAQNDINVLDFFDSVHAQAKKHGGAVYSLLGNHELMNASGDFKYVSYENFHKFVYRDQDQNQNQDLAKIYTGPDGRTRAFRQGGPVAKKLACTRNSVLVIGSTMFVHAGVLPVLARKLDYLNIDNRLKLEYLNAIVRKWLLHKLTSDDKFAQSTLINDPKISPFWTRIYGAIPINTGLTDTESKCYSHVKRAIQVYKVGQLVVGHTPQLFTNDSGINGTCYESDGSNKLYRVDGGFAEAFKIFKNNHIIQVLEIIDDNKFNILTQNTFNMSNKFKDNTNVKHKFGNNRILQSDTETDKKYNINISEKYMGKISKFYAQNRVRGNSKRH